jgi:hypothetical protein
MVERVLKEIPIYKKFEDDLRERVAVCPLCRKEIRNIQEAKRLLEQLSSAVRA